MKIKNRAMRTTAAILSLAILHGAFGPQAWAQVVPVAVQAPVGGQAAAAGAAVTLGANGAAPSVMPSVSLTGSPLAAPAAGFAAAPSVAAALPASAIPAASRAAAPALSRSAAASLPAASPAAAAPSAAALAATPAASTPEKKAGNPASAAAPAATPAAEETISAGPRTASVGARISRRFAELKSFFGGKKDAGALGASAASEPAAAMTGVEGSETAHANGLTPAAAAPKDASAKAEVPAAPNGDGSDNNGSKKKFGWFGLGAAVATLIGAMLTMQVGLEAQGQAMATLTEKAFGDFSILAQVGIFAQIGSMVGQQLAQPVIGKLGLSKTYYVAHFMRAASIGAMIFLLGTGAMPLGLMYLFYAANGVMTGIAATADGTMRKILIGSGGGRQEKFRVIWQFSAEVIGVIAPIAFGMLVNVIGPSLVTAIYPAAIIAGLMILIARKVLPKDAAQKVETAAKKLDEAAGKKAGAWAGLKAMGRTMKEGYQIVMHTPVLKWSFLGAATFDILNPFLYRLFAPGYGKMLAGAAGMSPIQGLIVGLFSFGGLATAFMLLMLQRKMKAQAQVKALTPEQSEELQRKSVLRWTLMGVPAVFLLATFALSMPALGALVALPSFLQWAGALTLPAVAMIPFGFFQVAASVKLNSFFVDSLPDPDKDPANKEKVQKAIAFEGSAMTLLSIIGMLAMKPLFGHLATFNPFPWIAAATIPLAIALFVIQRRLAAATKAAAQK